MATAAATTRNTRAIEAAKASTVMPPLAVSIEKAAATLSIGRAKMYQLVASGEVKSVRVGTRRIIAVAELEAFLRRQTETEDNSGV